jgi:DNA-binding transcriptional regulator GbsR (MarR family)
MSLDDLADTLRISKGSVSMNMRALERWGIAKEVWVRGARRKYYQAESDLWQVIRNVLGGREQREVQLDRIDELQSFFQFAQLALQAILGSEDSLDFDAITRIEIGGR